MAPKKKRKSTCGAMVLGWEVAFIGGYGEVVLGETTLPFNEAAITHFVPLYLRAVAALGFFPTHITADAAFDGRSHL